jgi:hypothetical protein
MYVTIESEHLIHEGKTIQMLITGNLLIIGDSFSAYPSPD